MGKVSTDSNHVQWPHEQRTCTCPAACPWMLTSWYLPWGISTWIPELQDKYMDTCPWTLELWDKYPCTCPAKYTDTCPWTLELWNKYPCTCPWVLVHGHLPVGLQSLPYWMQSAYMQGKQWVVDTPEFLFDMFGCDLPVYLFTHRYIYIAEELWILRIFWYILCIIVMRFTTWGILPMS